ncbi:glucosyltransferase [Kickxella alabastrina]|uniref:Glucosyltransferase n=1 Tax=Kickxella alabastrina TaxID=61397 RepID=A0ACC1I9M7_9FUNG|nr:glucosyltransferase [Kickxella alabastrina]
MTRLSILATGGIFAAYAAVSYAVLQQVNMNVPNAYMDEIFHIPQAQHYCQGNFHVWDPKLTTPPGLYLFSTLLNRILGHLCSVSLLRHTNWITSLVLFWIIRDLQGQLRPGAQLALKSLSLALFPVTFFLNHLYYTDTLSLALVLGMYTVSLRDRHWAAGGLGFLSLWVRQTNVIWVVFVASTVALRQVHGSMGEQVKLLASWCLSKRAVVLAPYAMVVALFAGFVVANGGIVLGDKENHRADMHLTQILYFLAYIMGVSAPALVPIVSPLWFVRSISKR